MTDKNNIDINKITQDVGDILATDKSGHGMEHVDRVLVMAMDFAQKEGADSTIVQLAALLHDIDDYKLFGQKHADELINANKILDEYTIDERVKSTVLDIIRTMGYSKYLEGIRPKTIEGMVVSDADMCDAIGATGILRTHAYTLVKDNEFFDKNISPDDSSVSAAEYRVSKKSHSAQHFFDKLLVIPSLLMTESGKEEGEKRKLIMTQFLHQLFQEEGALDWLEYLDEFEERKRGRGCNSVNYG